MTTVAKPGQSVAFDVTGPTTLATTVTVDGDARGTAHDGVEAGAHARLTMDFETYIRLVCGRAAAGDVHVDVTGDQALGRAVLERLAITP